MAAEGHGRAVGRAAEEELWARLREADEMPYGPAQIAFVEQVIQHADAGRFADVAFSARMLATTAYVYGGEPAKSFVTFSWCLAEYDRNAGRRGPYHDHLLLWHFKYMVGALTKFPDLPLDRAYAVLDDMERRYRAGGHSLHAVYAYRHRVAAHLGDTAAADEWYARWCAFPRGELSDCAGCDPMSKVEHLAATGRDEEAVALAEPVLSGQLSCVQQPHGMQTALLLPYLRTGRLAEAAGAHRRAYLRLRPDLRNLAWIGEHVQFCALTGNEARGLEIVQRHLAWLDRPASPYDAMEFASAAALVLSRLARAGHGDLTVVLPPAFASHPWIRRCGETTVCRLADELAGSATALAASFDERNGTKHQGGRIAARLAAEPLVEHLPLSPTATRPALRQPAVPEVPPRSAAELLDLAEQFARTDRLGEARAVWRAFDERFGGGEVSPHEAARRAEGRGQDLAERRDLAGAEAAWRRAADLYRQAGDEIGAQAASGRIGLLLCLSDRAGEGLAQLEQTTAYLLAHGGAERRASAESRLGTALLAAGRPVEALAALDRAAVHAAGSGDAYLVADLVLRRAHCLSTLHRLEEQREAAARARELFRDLSGEGYAEACLLYGDSFRDPGEATTALAAYDEAVRAAASGRVAAEARLARARALSGLGRAADAVDDFVEVVAGYTELDAPDGATFARYELAGAYRQAGRLAEAAEAAEEAVAGLDRMGEVQVADRCRYLLAGIYRELGADEPALALLDQLAANLDGFDNLAVRARMHEQAGEIHYRADRDMTAADRFAAAATAFARAGLVLDELRARRRAALALHWAGDRDATLAALAEVDALAARLPADLAGQAAAVWEKAMTGYETTKILIGADRLDEALPRIQAAPAAFRSVEAFGEALLAELLLGELLLRMSRPGAAEPVLRAVLAGLPRDAEAVPQAAWLLAEALAMLGRTGEAAELRAHYGLNPD